MDVSELICRTSEHEVNNTTIDQCQYQAAVPKYLVSIIYIGGLAVNTLVFIMVISKWKLWLKLWPSAHLLLIDIFRATHFFLHGQNLFITYFYKFICVSQLGAITLIAVEMLRKSIQQIRRVNGTANSLRSNHTSCVIIIKIFTVSMFVDMFLALFSSVYHALIVSMSLTFVVYGILAVYIIKLWHGARKSLTLKMLRYISVVFILYLILSAGTMSVLFLHKFFFSSNMLLTARIVLQVIYCIHMLVHPITFMCLHKGVYGRCIRAIRKIHMICCVKPSSAEHQDHQQTCTTDPDQSMSCRRIYYITTTGSLQLYDLVMDRIDALNPESQNEVAVVQLVDRL